MLWLEVQFVLLSLVTYHVYCHLAFVVAGVARAQRAASLCEPKTLSIQRSLCSLNSTDSDTTKLAVSAVY